jgi:uracil-DNA glycosylase
MVIPKKSPIDGLNDRISICNRCSLSASALHSVPGEGNLHAKIMFIGEAPGRNEDETGRPFVGRAGKLLDELLKSIDIERKTVFITSIIKHRPPKNRPPKPGEIKMCSYWLNKQLDIINPKLIVTLGRFGLEYFVPEAKISLWHGTIIEESKKNKHRIFPVYHPAAGLRSTKNKVKLFRDFKKLKQIINSL